VERKDPECGDKKLGEVAVTELAMLPEALAPVGNGLKNELDGPHGDLPAHEEAEVPADVDVLRRNGQALYVEDGLELREQGNDEVLIGIPVADACVYLLQGEAAQQFQHDVVDVAPESEVPPHVGQPQEF